MNRLTPNPGVKIEYSSLFIEASRIVLIPLGTEHAQQIFEEFTTEITRYMVPAPVKHIEEVYDFIERSRKGIETQQELILAIARKQDSEFLGVCAIHGNRNPAIPELGIWLKKSAHGKKLGREAIHALAYWAQTNLRIEGFCYPCDRDNIPSRKIAESLGGIIIAEGEQRQSMSGTTLNELVYKIPIPL